MRISNIFMKKSFERALIIILLACIGVFYFTFIESVQKRELFEQIFSSKTEIDLPGKAFTTFFILIRVAICIYVIYNIIKLKIINKSLKSEDEEDKKEKNSELINEKKCIKNKMIIMLVVFIVQLFFDILTDV